MNADFYTKTMLTVIAACLVWICVTNVTPVASAQVQQPLPTRVMLVDERGAPLATALGLPVTFTNAALPVTISQTVPVAITAIERRGNWQPLAVEVLRQQPTSMPIP
jgi:hypothetical protein